MDSILGGVMDNHEDLPIPVLEELEKYGDPFAILGLIVFIAIPIAMFIFLAR